MECREQAAAERELQAARREELAAEGERAALCRAALVALGAEGDGLVDAERLLAVGDEEADETQIQSAAEAREKAPEVSRDNVSRQVRHPVRGDDGADTPDRCSAA